MSTVLTESSLKCTVNLEWINQQHSVIRKALFKTADLRIIRNDFREIFVEIQREHGTSRYLMKNFVIHNRFMNEGKTCINFQELSMKLMISNAPPANLHSFLKTLYIKLNGEKDKPPVGIRSKLLSGVSNTIQEISPITLQELNKAKSLIVKSGNEKTTPKSGISEKREGLKRSSESENNSSTTRKIKKKSNFGSLVTVATLNKDQNLVLQAALSGQNIFFTGSAGTGKSFLLRRIIGALPPDVTVATASTGVAACYIGGQTLHSFAGIGSGQASIEKCIELANRPQVKMAWRKCRHLIIDEISMVEASFFDKLEQVARAIKNSDRPFGGIQLILCGDFLQLPPVNRDKQDKVQFCFQSSSWFKCITRSYELNDVHRQSEQKFIDILQSIRVGRVTAEISEVLLATSKQKIEKKGILPTRLCCLTKDVDLLNNNKLEQLSGIEKTFVATDTDPVYKAQLDQQTPVPNTLRLRIGAQVMLMKNINLSDGLANGARGVVTKFSENGFPVIRFKSKQEIEVLPERWTVKSGNVILTRKQIPLKLAWAFSIHKSQGLTLDCVEMSLAQVFEVGQAYVALSRAKSLDSLRVLDFDPKQVKVNQEVLQFYRKLRRDLQATEIVPVKKFKSKS